MKKKRIIKEKRICDVCKKPMYGSQSGEWINGKFVNIHEKCKKKEKFETWKLNNSDLRLTILGCFRYSLGRMTYMPSHTVEVIKKCDYVFNEQDWKRFIEEIDECDNLGMSCDKETWYELKRFCEMKLNKNTIINNAT